MPQAIDMYTGRELTRPNPHVNYRYEFDFTCDGEWLYLNSFVHPGSPELHGQKALVETYGERWRLVDAWTGEIVEQADAADRSWLHALLGDWARYERFFRSLVGAQESSTPRPVKRL
jgi:hypothetical protein